jgi:hypothetical protein
MRRWKRKRSGALCIVSFRGGNGPGQYILSNYSRGGARLSGIVHTDAVPEFVVLFVRDRRIMEFNCRVVWRGSRDVGVQYLGPPKLLKLEELPARL